eukprot:7435847-Pyramimonas_sp.AAC.1
MTEDLRCAEECDILQGKCMTMGVDDEVALKVAKQELGEKGEREKERERERERDTQNKYVRHGRLQSGEGKGRAAARVSQGAGRRGRPGATTCSCSARAGGALHGAMGEGHARAGSPSLARCGSEAPAPARGATSGISGARRTDCSW